MAKNRDSDESGILFGTMLERLKESPNEDATANRTSSRPNNLIAAKIAIDARKVTDKKTTKMWGQLRMPSISSLNSRTTFAIGTVNQKPSRRIPGMEEIIAGIV